MSTELTEFSQPPSNTQGHELATTGAAAEKQYEIQSAIIIARRFPRNEADCFQRLMKACSRPSFAEDATYNFPRGDAEVSGPSVNLAREAARVWGNIRFGLYVVRDDDDSRLIRAWAWDVETNTKIELEDDFKKLIQRKGKGWIVPDERDLRELTNRRGAIILRNALLQVLPKDLIEDALFTCQKALTQSAAEDPESVRKRLLVDFGTINVSVEQLERRLGHPFAQSTPKEMTELRAIFKSIADGNSTWSEYEAKAEEPTQSKEQVDDVRNKLKQAQAEQKPAEKQDPKPAESKPAESTAMELTEEESKAFTAAESKWKDMLVYMSEDPDRAKLLKSVKDKFGASSVAKLPINMREGFLNTLKDDAKKLKVKLDL